MKANLKFITGIALCLPLLFTSCSTEEKNEKYPYQEVENEEGHSYGPIVKRADES